LADKQKVDVRTLSSQASLVVFKNSRQLLFSLSFLKMAENPPDAITTEETPDTTDSPNFSSINPVQEPSLTGEDPLNLAANESEMSVDTSALLNTDDAALDIDMIDQEPEQLEEMQAVDDPQEVDEAQELQAVDEPQEVQKPQEVQETQKPQELQAVEEVQEPQAVEAQKPQPTEKPQEVKEIRIPKNVSEQRIQFLGIINKSNLSSFLEDRIQMAETERDKANVMMASTANRNAAYKRELENYSEY
jgi:hypothetical protein